MEENLTGLVPGLSLEETLYRTDCGVSLDTVSNIGSPSGIQAGGARARSPLDMEARERGRLVVDVVPAAFHRQTSTQMPTYEMYRRPRGLALVIDIEVYENDVQESRTGSNVDLENLRSLLKGLEFDVTVHKNLHLAAFFKVITEFCCNKSHKEGDMTIVAILSHGKDGVIYAADGQSINMEYIYEFFNNRNCPSLRGKPKFFIVQACRGDWPDSGVDGDISQSQEETSSQNSSQGSQQSKKRRAEALDAVASVHESDICRARPTWEDMIIAYSTIPGYASLRDHEHGTWFVQSLVEVFMAHAHDTELVDLLRMTSERLSHFTNEQGEKQTCNVEMRHLYKRIYFNPGLGLPLMSRPKDPQWGLGLHRDNQPSGGGDGSFRSQTPNLSIKKARSRTRCYRLKNLKARLVMTFKRRSSASS